MTQAVKTKRRERWVRIGCGIVTVAVVQFVAVVIVGIVVFPGGEALSQQFDSYAYSAHTLSDLGKMYDPPLANHTMAIVYNASMVLFMFSFLPFWLLLPRLFPNHPKLGRLIRIGGAISIAGMVGVGLTPSNQFPYLHLLTIGVAGVPGLSSLVVAIWAMGRDRACPRSLAYAIHIFAAVALFAFGMFIRHFAFDYPWSQLDVVAEKWAFHLGLPLIVWCMLLIYKRAGTPTNEPDAGA